jgi:predicted ArsR family transcriptional regulator
MTPGSPAAIGRTLSRLGRLSHGEAALEMAGGTREEVRRVIAEADGPLTIDQLCESTGLHPNTLRPHLELLLAVGSISREQGAREGRGRPPWHYRAVQSPAQLERRRLETALLRQLHEADSGELASAAATRWAAQQGEQPRAARTVDEAVDDVGESLSRIGFEVTITPGRDRVDLGDCPYADLVAERPVICDIHAALLQQLLEGSGQPVALDRLEVWSSPGTCTAHLRRPDRAPHRTITSGSTA